jgi:hypothetical protein
MKECPCCERDMDDEDNVCELCVDGWTCDSCGGCDACCECEEEDADDDE